MNINKGKADTGRKEGNKGIKQMDQDFNCKERPAQD